MSLSVGQKVFMKPVGNNARYGNVAIKEYYIKKIGRKYYYVWNGKSEYSIVRFNIEDNTEETNYSPNWNIYFSMQEIEDEKEYNVIRSELREIFSSYGRIDLKIEQLREIKRIIDHYRRDKRKEGK